MSLPAEQVLCPLDAKASQRSFHLVERPHLIAAIADIGQPGLDLGRQGARGEPNRSSGRTAIAFKQMASSAGRSRGGAAEGREDSRAGHGRGLGHISIGERGVPDEQAVERCAQPIDIARRPDLIEVARRLLRAHVPRRSHRGAGERQRGIPRAGRSPAPPALGGFLDRQRLGDSPINDERLTEWAEHDVFWLQVPVHDPSAMCIGDRVARGDKALQQPAKGHFTLTRFLPSLVRTMEPRDRRFERLSLNEPHDVIRPAGRISPRQ